MKAKIKPLIILIAVFAVSLVAGIFAGCSIGEKTAQDLAKEMGLTCPVTYYANGGQFTLGTSPEDQVYKTVYYKPESPIFNIGETESLGQNVSIQRKGYLFTGWEYCVLDAEGNPVLKDEEGNVLEVLENGTADIKGSNGRQLLEQNKRFTAEPNGTKAFADGNIVIHRGDHIYLAATWIQDVVLEYRLVTDTPIKTEELDGEGNKITYNTGDVIATESFRYSQLPLNATKTPKTFSTHSYVQLYHDIECTEPVKSGESVAKPQDNKNVVIYAKYLEGKWTTLRTASDVAIMLSDPEDKNYYMAYDIDCAGHGFSLKSSTFNSRVEGNGFTISNLQINQQIVNATSVALFGELGAKAQINNLTIENIEASVSVRNNFTVTIHALFSGVAQGAVIKNVNVKNYTLSIRLAGENALINNIQKDNTGKYQTDKWLYGTDTDAEFVSVYGEVVQNATLIINNEQVTGGQQ